MWESKCELWKCNGKTHGGEDTELNERLRQQEEKFQKSEIRHLKDRKEGNRLEIGSINDEIMSKSEELDELIKDKTVDAMLMMQLIANKPIDDKRNYRIEKNEASERKDNAMLLSQKEYDDLARRAEWPLVQLLRF